VTNAGRRRTVVHAARDRKARPDVATGGDPTAMTMRVVDEAVEPRARTYIYAHKNQGLHKRDKLREQLRHGLQESYCGCLFVPREGSPPGWAGTRGYLRDRKTCVRDGVKYVLLWCEYVLLWCEYIVVMAPSAYQGRVVMPTGPLSRVDAWGGAWEAVEDVPCRPCIWLKKGYPFRG
jgi:hypothetical protein